MDKLEIMIIDFFDRPNYNYIGNKHTKYGDIFIRPKRGRGRGLTEPYLLRCKRKSIKKRGISGCYFDKEKKHYRFYSYHDSFYRTQANKLIRRLSNEEIIIKGSIYRKMYPYECKCW